MSKPSSEEIKDADWRCGQAGSVPLRQVRAVQTPATLIVYQAYGSAIADAALNARRFVAPFKRNRMTWIKPSLLWMAYRSGWATKTGQERVLAVEIARTGFEWALAHSCLSHFDPAIDADRGAWTAAKEVSPVRVQWDPERDLHLGALQHRTIQVGLSADAVDRYLDQWTVAITDATELVRRIGQLVQAGDLTGASDLLPDEVPYALPSDIASLVGTNG